ncbi:MAG: hypothetical protein ACYTGC_09450 [Planctomycetota bacterium]|jgi:hypothetical protein
MADDIDVRVDASTSMATSMLRAGLTGQHKAMTMRTALGDAGLLDANLRAAIDALDATGRQLTTHGAEALRVDAVGQLLDVLG